MGYPPPPDTHRGGIAGKPNHDTVPSARALVCHLVLPCATFVVHARRVRHSLCPAILLPQCCLPLHCRRLPHLPLLLACPNQKLRGRSLGVFREKEKKTCVNVCECTYSPTSIGSLYARRHPGGLGTEQTLSPLIRVLVSFEHEAGLLYTRHQNPYTVAT